MGNRTIAMLKAESYDSKKAKQLGPDMAVVTALMDMIILDSCSFLDEYNKGFGVTTEETYIKKILEIKSICRPIVLQINKWKDLRIVRNSFVAHNLRTKNNVMVFRTLVNYNAPRGIFEVELLNHCIQLINKIIQIEFKDEIEYAKQNFKLNISPFDGFTKDDCWQVVDNLVIRINQNLEQSNRSYIIK
jgi:hypothetical protein